MGREDHPSPTIERLLADLAGSQHGVVSRQQLLAAGISSRVIHGRLARGGLLRIHRGIYAVGHAAPDVRRTYLAAALAGGDDALLCRRPAAHLHRLIRGQPPIPEIVARNLREIPGVRTHRSRTSGSDGCEVDGIPVTTVPRTLVDIAADLSLSELARAAHETSFLCGVRAREVGRVLDRRPNSPGAASLKQVMQGDVKVTMSSLERRFLVVLRRAKLKLPETNVPAGGRYVDCRWPAERLTVELDGFSSHSSRHAWERDRLREREAYARGDDFRRYSYADVLQGPGVILRELRPLLQRGAG